MNADQVKVVREKLGMSPGELAKALGIKGRSVERWEEGSARPTGAAEAVLDGIAAFVDLNPERAQVLGSKLSGMSRIGGLSYIILRTAEGLAPAQA